MIDMLFRFAATLLEVSFVTTTAVILPVASSFDRQMARWLDAIVDTPQADARASIWRQLWRGMVASREQAARRITLPHLAALDDEALMRLGHSPSEIRDLRARARRST